MEMTEQSTGVSQSTFAGFLCQSEAQYIAWVRGLSYCEKYASLVISRMRRVILKDAQAVRPDFIDHHIEDEKRHSKILFNLSKKARQNPHEQKWYNEFEQANISLLKGFVDQVGALVAEHIDDPTLQYYTVSLILETHITRHYDQLAQTIPNKIFRTALNSILVDEAEHTHEMKMGMHSLANFSPELYQDLLGQSDTFFETLVVETRKIHSGYLATA